MIKPRGLLIAAFLVAGFAASAAHAAETPPATYCNPLDLPYRFQLEAPSRREAADPTMVVFQNQYWLFASKSGGYWHSKDLLHWDLIVPTGLPIEGYAPTVMVLDGKMHWMADSDKPQQLFSTDDPAKGDWKPVADLNYNYGDPDLFADDNGRVYIYYGLSNITALRVAELDTKNGFKKGPAQKIPASRDSQDRGWENRGDNNELVDTAPWVEGAWMTKHDGKYYLQYSAPGTEFKTYGDGVLVADNPMGPFTYAPYSPFAFKVGGFISGAGHSSTFEDLDSKWWHISTMTISVRHMFERRLGLFPVHFEKDGQMAADTYLGDYPHLIGGDRALAGWMLLSYDKTVSASTTLNGHDAAKAVDEDIRSWWSAKTGNADEWFQVDLGGQKRINALQINFADEGATALGRIADGYGYFIEASDDAKTWRTLIDHRTEMRDSPDDYEPLPQPMMARYVRITNAHIPAGALFSLSGLRIFGNGMGKPPATVEGTTVMRDATDPRRAKVEWQPAPGADFYVVRLGNTPDRMFMNYQVYKTTQLDVRSLTAGQPYYFTVDAVNENGIMKGTSVVQVK